MPYYKDLTNTIHFLSEDDIAVGGLTVIPQNSQEIPEEEVQQFVLDSLPKIDPKNQAISYLLETDWYVIRKIETNEDIPTDVLNKRAQARETLNG